MTTGAGKLPSLSKRIHLALQGMISNGMALLYINEARMTTDTKIVDWFIQLKTVLTGVGIVADDTTTTINNAMWIETNDFFPGFSLVIVTTNAEINFTISPELKLVGISMGVMTDSTVTYSHRSMNMLLVFELYLIYMTLETYIVNSAGKYGNFCIATPFSMAAHAV